MVDFSYSAESARTDPFERTRSLNDDFILPSIPDSPEQVTTIDLWDCIRIMFVDPASGKKSRLEAQKSRQAIVVIAQDYAQRIFAVSAWAGRLPQSQFEDKILSTGETYQPKILGIEANGLQSLFVDSMTREAERRKKRLPIVPVSQPTDIDKDFRIRTILEPAINFGRLFVMPGATELVYELRGFPTAKTKDLVDALASAIKLLPPRSLGASNDLEVKNLAAYLRQRGVPASQIKRRIEALTGQQTEGLWKGKLDQRAFGQQSDRPF